MAYVLVKFSADYADEFDVNGFMVTTTESWDEEKENAETVFDEEGIVERYFGTNEAVTFDSYEDWLRCFKVVEITEDEFKTIMKLFGNPYSDTTAVFGTWIDI